MSKASAVESNKSDHKDGSSDRQHDPLAIAFGERIRARAADLGLTAAEIGRKAGIKKQSMQGYWAGERLCGANKLFALADALDLDPRFLIEGVKAQQGRHLLDAADADWVALDRFDLRHLTDLDKGELVESLPFRKDWLFRQLNRSSGLWLAELPSDYQPDDLTEGDLVVCSDIIEGDGPKDRWLCIFRGAAGPFVGRYSEVPGLRSNERPNETIIAPANLADGEIRPVARIHARLIARL